MIAPAKLVSPKVVVAMVAATMLVSFLRAAPPRIDPPPTVLIVRDPGVQMRAKLQRSKQILEGLVREDYATISRAARELDRICLATDWPLENDAKFKRHQTEFSTLCKALDRSAIGHDRPGVIFNFLGLADACIRCHDHLRDQVVPGTSSLNAESRFVPQTR